MTSATDTAVLPAVTILDLDESWYVVFDVDGRRVGLEQASRTEVSDFIAGVAQVEAHPDQTLVARVLGERITPQAALGILGISYRVAEAASQWQGAATFADGLAHDNGGCIYDEGWALGSFRDTVAG